MRVPALYFTSRESLSRVVTCPFLGCGSAPSVCAVTVQSCSLPCTGAGLGHLGVCLSSLELIDGNQQSLVPNSPESRQAAYLPSLVRVPGQGLPASCWLLCEHRFQLPALLGCHKPLLCSEQASPPSWDNSGTSVEICGGMEGIKCYLPVPEQHGMPCLGLYSMSHPFLPNSQKSTCFLALDLPLWWLKV